MITGLPTFPTPVLIALSSLDAALATSRAAFEAEPYDYEAYQRACVALGLARAHLDRVLREARQERQERQKRKEREVE